MGLPSEPPSLLVGLSRWRLQTGDLDGKFSQRSGSKDSSDQRLLGRVNCKASHPSKFLSPGDSSSAEAVSSDEPGVPSEKRSFLPCKRIQKFNRHCDSLDAFWRDYEITDGVLGKGVNGAVKLARCRVTGRDVAVKSLSKEGLSHRRLQLLRQEIDVHLNMDHPHIVRLDRVYESDSEAKLVMERLEGGELFDYILKHTSLEECVVAGMIKQCLLAIAYMHGQGYMHRDVKMENLILTRKGSNDLKLIDFGFAMAWDGMQALSERCGTLQYVAPQVLNGGYTNKCDMWSIGAVAYILLTGRTLHNGSDREIRSKIMSGKLDISRSFLALPRSAQDFVRALLNPNQTERLSAAQALRHPWLLGCTRPRPVLCRAMLQRVVMCAQQPQAVRAVLSAVAWCLPAQAEESFWEHFLALDVDNDGIVSLQDLEVAIRSALPQESPSLAEAVLTALELGGSLSFRVLAAAGPALEADDKTLLAAFRRFDLAGAGECSEAQLQEALAESSGGSLLSFVNFRTALRGTDFLPNGHQTQSLALETATQTSAWHGYRALSSCRDGAYGGMSCILGIVKMCFRWVQAKRLGRQCDHVYDQSCNC